MRKAGLVLVVVAMCNTSWGQTDARRERGYSISAGYSHEFVLDGYVRVREWALEGDKLRLNDLGMRNYSALQIEAKKYLRKGKRIDITYDHYFVRGSATLDRDVAYNGTIIEGRRGIDVSPTRYYRLTATFAGPLVERADFGLTYRASLIVDHITFYVDGHVSPASPGNEVHEGFGRQAFPYPVLGLEGKVELSERADLRGEIGGTYVPRFKSFYTEGGHVHLQYETVIAGLEYFRMNQGFAVSLGAKLRYMFLFQESKEDTNILSLFTVGPYARICFAGGGRRFP